MAKRFASVSEDELCEKCIIKQLLNSVSHDIMNYQNLVSVLSASADLIKIDYCKELWD